MSGPVDVLAVMDRNIAADEGDFCNPRWIAEMREARTAVAELIEAHKLALATIDSYLAYSHDGDPWKEDARAMGEMDINDFARDGRLQRCRAAIARVGAA
jgi:hypothetical protein